MATLTYSYVTDCSVGGGGGGHVVFDITLGGVGTRRVVYTVDELRQPLGALTQDEQEAAALVIAKLSFAGKTRQEIKAKVTAPGGHLVVL